MHETGFHEVVKEICSRDSRFTAQAYAFIRDALDFTTKKLKKPAEGRERHVTGRELLVGFREFAIQQFGPMSRTVLASWGIHHTSDIGEIVFNLVEAGKLGKTDQDSKTDFSGGYDFSEAFVQPYLPKSTTLQRRRKPRKSPTRKRRSQIKDHNNTPNLL